MDVGQKIRWINANGSLYHKPAARGTMVITTWHPQYNPLSGGIEAKGEDYCVCCNKLYDDIKDTLYGVCLVLEQG